MHNRCLYTNACVRFLGGGRGSREKRTNIVSKKTSIITDGPLSNFQEAELLKRRQARRNRYGHYGLDRSTFCSKKNKTKNVGLGHAAVQYSHHNIGQVHVRPFDL